MRAGFIFGEAITGIRRNITMTIAMVLTTAISLLLLGMGLVLTQITDRTGEMYGDKVHARVNLTLEQTTVDQDCREEVCQNLLTTLQAMPEVESFDYFSQDQAWADSQRLFADQPELLQVTRKEALTAYIRVFPVQPEELPAIVEAMKGQPGVLNVADLNDSIISILNFFDRIRLAAIFLAAAAGIAAVMLIANMVQVAALSRKAETTIMRLVGASRWRTQLPFMIETVLAALVGVGIAIGLLAWAKTQLLDQILGPTVDANVISPARMSDVWYAAFWIGPLGIVLTAITSYITLRILVRK